ncbi:MAG: universal stress protein [Thermodesulfobacteriota bacterium]
MTSKDKKILYATDFSRGSWTALKHAVVVAKSENARVYCLHVMPEIPQELKESGGLNVLLGYGPGSVGIAPDIQEKFMQERKEKERKTQGREIEKAKEIIKDHIKSVVTELKSRESRQYVDIDKSVIRIGQPVEEILEEIETGYYDMLVMGRRGHGKLKGPRMGGVVRSVVNRSSIPIMVVPDKSKK